MRRLVWISLLGLGLVAASAASQGYGIGRDVTHGGGVSEAAGYSLRSVIGQHEAGVLAGGDYRLSGGFLWPMTAATPAPTELAPELTPTPVVTPPAPALYPLFLPLIHR